MAAVKSKDPAVRERAIGGLGRSPDKSSRAVEALVHLLDDKQWTVRRRAAQALGKRGPSALSAIPALTKALRERTRFWGHLDLRRDARARAYADLVFEAASEALLTICEAQRARCSQAVAFLESQRASPSPSMRALATRYLARFGR